MTSETTEPWTEMHVRFDQHGQPWIIFKRVGSWWASGMLAEEERSIMRLVGDEPDWFVTDYKYPNAIRKLGPRVDAGDHP